MTKYKQVTMDFMSKELLKDTGNAQQLFSMSPSNTEGADGHTMFVCDPQLLNRALDADAQHSLLEPGQPYVGSTSLC